jgi:predicted phosphohydrolase
MKLLWVTDPHLNFLSRRARQRFGRALAAHGDALLVTGDIAESPSLVRILRDLAGSYAKSVYFVLGNHDFYGSSIVRTGQLAAEISGRRLHWLTRAGAVRLSEETALVGHDGFYDGRNGTPLNDWGNLTFICLSIGNLFLQGEEEDGLRLSEARPLERLAVQL